MTARPLRATYRLQFHAGFTFADAERLVSYLASLGISHLYASPIFAARRGSTHGYDGVDPGRIDPALGGEAGFEDLVKVLHEAGMGLVLDIVPNHLAIDRRNLLLMEALCLGPDAETARIFDIDWSGGQVPLPVLGNDPATALAEDEIALRLDPDTGFILARYHEHGFPLRPASVAELLEAAGIGLAVQWKALEDRPDRKALATARAALAGLGPNEARALARALEAADVATVLEAQHWRLANWRTAQDALSHRRFFNITGLIGVRVEDPAVFAETQRLAIELVRRGDVDGLRIDHIDGLADPGEYCRRLREAIGPDAPIFVEKILGPDEKLPDWPVDGTTGYERLNEINRLFVDPGGYERLDRHLEDRGFLSGSARERLAAAKRQVLEESFRPEVDRLARLAGTLTGAEDEAGMREAVVGLLVRFPVYRSYASARGVRPEDEAMWNEALEGVCEHGPAECARLAAELAARALGEDDGAATFRTRFQQLSGPAMAKGLEDTELYRSVALVSVNEVGGDPGVPAMGADAAHDLFSGRAGRGDTGLIPLATHDTKRGADTRARINVLSWDAERWIALVGQWTQMNRPLKALVDGIETPDGLDEWLIYQTLLGTWPIEAERLGEYLTKAMREAKRHTRWEEPDEAYEEATIAFATALLESPTAAGFRREFEVYADETNKRGRTNSIAQTILQLTLPGVPDIYRGTELWDHSLVDPDNRRPVDWPLRKALNRELSAPDGLDEDPLGAGKLAVIEALLALRADAPELFATGDYVPVKAGERWFAFLRGAKGRRLLVAVPLRGAEDAPKLPEGVWRDVLGGRIVTALEPDWPFVTALAE